MTSATIQSKIKAGLARASVVTGSSSTSLVYLISSVTTSGTPIATGVTTETTTLLPNAIFKSYDAKTIDANILAGDRQLICDGDTVIKQGDAITQGASKYNVESVDIKAPTSDVLAYILQVRLK